MLRRYCIKGFWCSGSSVISIRNPDDLSEIWSDIKKGKRISLWCDGLKTKGSVGGVTRTKWRQATYSDIEETDEERMRHLLNPRKRRKKRTAQEDREENYHWATKGTQYFVYTYAAPNLEWICCRWQTFKFGRSSYLVRAGKGTLTKKKEQSNSSGVSDALTQAVLSEKYISQRQETYPLKREQQLQPWVRKV